jgi:hypothetical protein
VHAVRKQGSRYLHVVLCTFLEVQVLYSSVWKWPRAPNEQSMLLQKVGAQILRMCSIAKAKADAALPRGSMMLGGVPEVPMRYRMVLAPPPPHHHQISSSFFCFCSSFVRVLPLTR